MCSFLGWMAWKKFYDYFYGKWDRRTVTRPLRSNSFLEIDVLIHVHYIIIPFIQEQSPAVEQLSFPCPLSASRKTYMAWKKQKKKTERTSTLHRTNNTVRDHKPCIFHLYIQGASTLEEQCTVEEHGERSRGAAASLLAWTPKRVGVVRLVWEGHGWGSCHEHLQNHH